MLQQIIQPSALLHGYIFVQAAVLDARCIKNDPAVPDRLYEARSVPFRWAVVLSAESIEERQIVVSAFSKGRSEIADNVLKLRAIGPVHANDLVVIVDDVVVVQKYLKDLQALKLVRADERVVMPAPSIESFNVVRPGFETNVLERPFSRDGQSWNQVCDLGLISESIE